MKVSEQANEKSLLAMLDEIRDMVETLDEGDHTAVLVATAHCDGNEISGSCVQRNGCINSTCALVVQSLRAAILVISNSEETPVSSEVLEKLNTMLELFQSTLDKLAAQHAAKMLH